MNILRVKEATAIVKLQNKSAANISNNINILQCLKSWEIKG